MGHRASYVHLPVHAHPPKLGLFCSCDLASIVPYSGFKTLDGDILFGGGNDRLFGLLCTKLGHPEWATDPRFVTNSKRVENRILIEGLIESVTRTKPTAEWLQIFEGSGMPYSAINDIQATFRHEHGTLDLRGSVMENRLNFRWG